MSKLIDWLTAGFLVLGGLLTTVVGAAVYAFTDREMIAEAVADGTINSSLLSDAELIDVTVALSTWGGAGIAITGVLLILGGIVFIGSRRRLHRQEERNRVLPDSTTFAIIGAVVTAVTSFVPLSPILGGTVAGYLKAGDEWEGVRIGAYTGVLTATPVAIFLVLLLGGVVISTVQAGIGGAGVVVSLILLLSVLFTVGVLVGLSALGGYVGAKLWERSEKAT